MSILSVRNLVKAYPKSSVQAVKGISFDLKNGEILGLLGPNGSGKTTTIQMLMSTLTPTLGEIVYFGKNLATHRSDILQHVTFASTYVSLPSGLTIEQNLNIFGRLFSLSPKHFAARRDELLERFGILSKKRCPVSTFSTGQITRLMLVKAFMVRPKITLLDEPTASLDPEIANDVTNFILEQREKEGSSILFTSHNMSEVAKVCDRVLILQNGRICADDTPQNLAKSVGLSQIELVIAKGVDKALKLIHSLQMEASCDHRCLRLKLKEEKIAWFLSHLAMANVTYSGIQIIQPTLEDFFLKVAGVHDES